MKNSKLPDVVKQIGVKAAGTRVVKTAPHRIKAESAKPALGYSPTGDEIKAAVLAAGLTQEAAAALIYSTRRTLQDWEANVAWMHPGLWELLKMKLENLSGQSR
jgi:DNA-binding transcriptional regulator YiaG